MRTTRKASAPSRPPPSPFYHGYLDAAKAGTEILADGIICLPRSRYPVDSDAHEVWMKGLVEFAVDRAASVRTKRHCPPWRRI